MKVDMLMPQMGESITEATISKWLKKVGDKVERDEMILEITTDKVDSEIPAPDSGILTEVKFQNGETVPVKQVIAVIDTEATEAANKNESKQDTSSIQAETTTDIKEPANTEVVEEISDVNTDDLDTAFASNGSRFYSPLVRSLASKHSISLNELDLIAGSGNAGRFTKDDFYTYLESKQNKKTSVPPSQTHTPSVKSEEIKTNTPPAVKTSAEVKSSNVQDKPINQWLPDGTKIVPMDNMRKAISEHMVRSKHTSPHVYSVQEADVSVISKWRSQYKDEFNKKEGFNLSFTPFFLEAAVKALQEFPIVNSSIQGNSVIYKKNINLGCAVALGNSGLIVPVIKNAEEKNFVGIARGLNDLALRAREKKLSPTDVMNGTFTVTNPGIFGTMIGTPIINQPQVAILCLGAIEKRPVVVDDMIAIKERCYLTLSYDHRIIDGSVGAQFLAFICNYLKNWDLKRTPF